MWHVQRRCSCSMWLVALYKCYMPLHMPGESHIWFLWPTSQCMPFCDAKFLYYCKALLQVTLTPQLNVHFDYEMLENIDSTPRIHPMAFLIIVIICIEAGVAIWTIRLSLSTKMPKFCSWCRLSQKSIHKFMYIQYVCICAKALQKIDAVYFEKTSTHYYGNISQCWLQACTNDQK